MRDPGNEIVGYPVLVTQQGPSLQRGGGGGGVNVLCNRLLTSRSSVVSLTAVMHAVLASLLDATQSRTCILAIQSQGIIVIKYKNMLGQNLQSN